MWVKAVRFVWRMVRDFFFGVGVFVFLSLLDVPLFSIRLLCRLPCFACEERR